MTGSAVIHSAEAPEFKRLAHRAYRRAKRWGRFSVPAGCEDCGKPGRLVGHHDNYLRPLAVRWLCPACHLAWHRRATH